MGEEGERRRTRTLFWGILLVGVVLRLWGVGVESFWQDESWSWMLIRGTPGELLETLQHQDAHPPLYYLILQGWSGFVGTSEAGLRSLSALFGILSLPLMFRFATRFGRAATGLFAMLFLALNPYHVYFSQEARSYSLLVLLCLLSLELLYGAVHSPRRWKWIALTLVTAALPYTHYMGAFFLLAECGAVLLLARDHPGILNRFALMGAGAFALFLPWLRVAGSHLTMIEGSFWIPSPTWRKFFEAMAELATYPIGTAIPVAVALTVPFFAAAAAVPIRTRRREHVTLLLLAAVPIAGELLVSLHRPVFYTRTFLYVLVPLLTLVSIGVMQCRRLPRTVLAAFLGAALVPGLVHVHVRTEKENWREAARLIRAGFRDREILLVHPGFHWVNLAYYGIDTADGRVRKSEAGPFGVDPKSDGTARHDVVDNPGVEGVWLILRHGRDDGWCALLDDNFTRRIEFRSHGVDVIWYRRR